MILGPTNVSPCVLRGFVVFWLFAVPNVRSPCGRFRVTGPRYMLLIGLYPGPLLISIDGEDPAPASGFEVVLRETSPESFLIFLILFLGPGIALNC